MGKIRVLIFIVLISLVNIVIQPSKAKLCAEESCKTVIATGLTTVRGLQKAKGYLGFRPNIPVKILARKAGPDGEHLLVEMQGQIGLVAKKHILEKKIHVRSEDLVEVSDVSEVKEDIEIESSIKDIKPTSTESLPEINATHHIVTEVHANVSDDPSTKATPVESQVARSKFMDSHNESLESSQEISLDISSENVTISPTSSSSETDDILGEMQATARHLLSEVEDNESSEEIKDIEDEADEPKEFAKEEKEIEKEKVIQQATLVNVTNVNEELKDTNGIKPEETTKEPEVPVIDAQIEEENKAIEPEEVPKNLDEKVTSLPQNGISVDTHDHLPIPTPPSFENHDPYDQFTVSETVTTTPSTPISTPAPSEHKGIYDPYAHLHTHYGHHHSEHDHHSKHYSNNNSSISLLDEEKDNKTTQTEESLFKSVLDKEKDNKTTQTEESLSQLDQQTIESTESSSHLEELQEMKVEKHNKENDSQDNTADTTPDHESHEKLLPESSIESNHMLPPLMRRHGNQRQTINKKEVETSEPEKIESEEGFIDNLLSTVSSIWPFNKETEEALVDKEELLTTPENVEEDEGFCEKLEPNECPKSKIITSYPIESLSCSFPQDFLATASHKMLENINLLAVTAIAGIIICMLIVCYNCMSNCQRESELIAKLNRTERELFAVIKEFDMAKSDLTGTQRKLTNIQDNSFGSNDMVIALKNEMDLMNSEKEKMVEHIGSLEKELDTATEAGLELNKIIAELLSAQNGDENIVSSVEELQTQLNEQQATILEINTILAQKSRENSELQILLAETNAKFVGEIESLKTDNEELENERSIMQSKLEEIKEDFAHDISAALESKNAEIRLLQDEIMHWRARYDEVNKNWQICEAKIEALQESLKQVKLNAGGKSSELLNIANVKADMSALKKENDIIKERLESQLDSKKSLTEQLKTVSEEMQKLKQDFHQAEKDKLEAQTRLEVLSNYFKDKETQLQKELSVKEAMWLKQQGETTTTVERVKNMQEEIQSLKSQNDSLRAEIEAQTAAHKAQIGTLENRAHETWLQARQSERKYEEARLEGANLRRKLTQISQNGVPQNTTDGVASNASANSVPSPIHMETPGSPLMHLPPPPPFLPASFIGLPPPPSMMGPGGGPPPPFPPMFLPPGEIRPPPLGRLMSPPPHHHNRYMDETNSILDDDYDDDEYDDYDEDRRPRKYSRNGRYTPDSRYDYTSRYDTETDFSPPPSPTSVTRSDDGTRRNGYRDNRERRNGGSQRSGNGLNDSSSRNKPKGLISSGSEKSYSSRRSKGHNV